MLLIRHMISYRQKYTYRPIEQAQVLPNERMTIMGMVTNQIHVESLGHGTYIAQLQLYMAGPWEISIEAHADGFESTVRPCSCKLNEAG
jgi:hypothetical protein